MSARGSWTSRRCRGPGRGTAAVHVVAWTAIRSRQSHLADRWRRGTAYRRVTAPDDQQIGQLVQVCADVDAVRAKHTLDDRMPVVWVGERAQLVRQSIAELIELATATDHPARLAAPDVHAHRTAPLVVLDGIRQTRGARAAAR